VREALHGAWAPWTDDAGADGVTDFYGLRAFAVRSLVETGETFAQLIPTSTALRVRLLEGDMLPMSETRVLDGGRQKRSRRPPRFALPCSSEA
jgi:capsid protein